MTIIRPHSSGAGVEVTLDDADMAEAAEGARVRYERAQRFSMRDRFGFDDGGQGHRVGCPPEVAVARWRGVPWEGAEPYDPAATDVDGLEVKSTKRADGNLLVKPHETDAAPYVLVIIAGRRFWLRGWAWGYEVKRGPLVSAPGLPPAHRRLVCDLYAIESAPSREEIEP